AATRRRIWTSTPKSPRRSAQRSSPRAASPPRARRRRWRWLQARRERQRRQAWGMEEPYRRRLRPCRRRRASAWLRNGSGAERACPERGVIDRRVPYWAMPRYHVTTFGCQMNEHDSERMKGMLEALGYREAAERAEADLILFNTCSI